MSQISAFAPSFELGDRWGAQTHEVANQPAPLENYNSYSSDLALQHSVKIHGASWADSDLSRFGAVTGSSEVIEWGFLANQNKPVLHTHNRHGQRVDEVRFHPAYHQLMSLAIKEQIHSSHWAHPQPGAHVARAAKSYLLTQVEAGHGCPITMTSAAIPALKNQPELFGRWEAKILSAEYDPRNVPHGDKAGLTIGMAMTEKQGGSDVRTNTTRAYAVGAAGPGEG